MYSASALPSRPAPGDRLLGVTGQLDQHPAGRAILTEAQGHRHRLTHLGALMIGEARDNLGVARQGRVAEGADERDLIEGIVGLLQIVEQPLAQRLGLARLPRAGEVADARAQGEGGRAGSLGPRRVVMGWCSRLTR